MAGFLCHRGDMKQPLEQLQGQIERVTFTNEETEREKFLEGCAEYVSVKNTAHKYMSSFHSMVTLIDGIMYIVVVGVGAYFMHLGEITPGDFAAKSEGPPP